MKKKNYFWLLMAGWLASSCIKQIFSGAVVCVQGAIKVRIEKVPDTSSL